MSEDHGERIAKLERGHEALSKEIDTLDEKKLSKHEFNGFKQVIDGLKDMFTKEFARVAQSTDMNTAAIVSIETTIKNSKDFLPALISTIKFFGTIIVMLVTFIGSKLLGWW